MLFSTIGQWKVLLVMCLAGMLVGAWYSALRLIRKMLSAGFWLSLAADLAFGAGAAGIFAAGLIFSSYGQVRLFSFLGAFLGAALWFIGPHALFGRAYCRISPKIRQIGRHIADNRLLKVIFK